MRVFVETTLINKSPVTPSLLSLWKGTPGRWEDSRGAVTTWQGKGQESSCELSSPCELVGFQSGKGRGLGKLSAETQHNIHNSKEERFVLAQLLEVLVHIQLVSRQGGLAEEKELMA